MRHLAAYLLLVSGGNTSPSAEDVTRVLGTVGIETDQERLTQLLTELEGKNVSELIALGKERLYVGGGGGGVSSSAAVTTGKILITHILVFINNILLYIASTSAAPVAAPAAAAAAAAMTH